MRLIRNAIWRRYKNIFVYKKCKKKDFISFFNLCLKICKQKIKMPQTICANIIKIKKKLTIKNVTTIKNLY